LVIVAAGLSVHGNGAGTVIAQASGACGLLTTAEIQPLAPKMSIGDGIATSFEAVGFSACRYTWGTGASRYKLDVTVNDASRMFAGAAPDLIKKGLQSSVMPDTADAVVSDIGEAAVFKAESPLLVHGSTYLKGRILQIVLDGFDAGDMKNQVIALLKSASSRL
jgi:hypothetical protein